MMGHTHALSGCVAWLAAIPLLERFGVSPSPVQLAAGGAICMGAALLPDIDHHDGTIANTFGPVTQILCKGIGKVFGGHRKGTHSLVFAIGTGFGVSWLAAHAVVVWLAILFLILGLGLRGIGFGVRGRESISAMLNAVVAAGATFLMFDLDFGRPVLDFGWQGITMGWAGLAVTIGCLAHVVGDCLTPKGCAVLWPAPGRLAIPLVSRTDGPIERWVVAPLLILGMLVLVVRSQLGSLAAYWLSYRA